MEVWMDHAPTCKHAGGSPPTPRALRPACSAGMTLSGTFTLARGTYREAYVNKAGGIVWPGEGDYEW
jgi:hypothetical protein